MSRDRERVVPGMRRLPRVAGFARLVALVCAASLADPATAQTQAEFESLLVELRAEMHKEHWDEVQARLVAALEAHRGGDYLPKHWTEIEEMTARCAFSADYERPDAKELVAGDLRSWNRHTGAIELRYRAGERGLAAATSEDPRAGDFFLLENGDNEEDALYLHPMLFKGPYIVEVRGVERSYDEPSTIFVGWDWNTFYAVVCGLGTAIFEVEDGRQRLLGQGQSTGGTFAVKLAAESISVSSAGRQVFKVERPRGDFGQFGFANLKGLEEVVIKGEIEPSWITGLADRELQHAWNRFREGYDPFERLPSWMKDVVLGEAKQAVDFLDAAPGSSDERNEKQMRKAKEFYERFEIDEGLAYAKDLPEEEASAETRAWIMSLFSFVGGDTNSAFEHCERVCTAAPEFYEARLLRIRLLRELRTKDEAAQELEKLVVDFPEYVDTYEALAELRFEDGDLEGVEGVIALALENGVSAQSTTRIGRNLLRARHGPPWTDPTVHESKHYVVTSDMDRSICFEIANELEEFFKKYNSNVYRIPGSSKLEFDVYFFSGVDGYESYCQDLFGYEPENTLGLYSGSVKQLLIWNSPDKRMVMRTVRHEGFHQYLDCLTNDAPRWLNEGLAEYFEQATLVRGSWRDDQLNEQHLAVLRAVPKWTPLEEFVHSDAAGFMWNADLHYPQAWAFVHFLSNGGRDKKKLLDALLDALIGGDTRTQALARVFGDLDWKQLEREFREYVDSLEDR